MSCWQGLLPATARTTHSRVAREQEPVHLSECSLWFWIALCLHARTGGNVTELSTEDVQAKTFQCVGIFTGGVSVCGAEPASKAVLRLWILSDGCSPWRLLSKEMSA